MNTAKLKTYAPQARKDFIKAVTERANYYGIFSDDHIEPIEFKGDVAIVGERAFTKKEGELREKLVNRIKRDRFELVMRACAYTWFNRFVALRYMELHDYLEHGYRVLSNNGGSDIPEILEHAADVDFQGLDKDKVVELRLAGNKDNELYRLLIVAQCNALHKAMPFLFERIDSETELLLPDNLLHSNSPIRKMVTEIDEEDWNDVEIIGWIYQFYISERKDEVIGKVVKSEDIPAATQLFTPNWIVKYMVQNTLGRMWLATYPDSPLKDKMEFYIEPAEQEPEVQEQLDSVTPKELNPEEITFLDPACGSGHILVEAYDILKEIYLERGYRTKDIPRLIIEKNLYGLDIDNRAAQLACFAVLMRARGDDRRILSRNDLKLNVMSISETRRLDKNKIIEIVSKRQREKDIQGFIGQLIDLFENGKTLGSLITVPDELTDRLPNIKDIVEYDGSDNEVLFEYLDKSQLEMIKPVIIQAQILSKKYDCVVTNPPYLSNKGMNSSLKNFAKREYRDSKSDAFAMFAENILAITKRTGNIGMVTPYVWMFLFSYERFRTKMLSKATITSLIQLEYNAFEPACVPVATFTIKKFSLVQYKGDFIKLSDFKGHQNQSPKTLEAIKNHNCDWRYVAATNDFKKIYGSPIAYWINENERNIFCENEPIKKICKAVVGLQSGDNDRFVRFWHEVNYYKIGLGSSSSEQAKQSGLKWFPFNKGGDFRKWYGNHQCVVNWENDGHQIRNFKDSNGKPRSFPRNTDYYFLPSITCSAITSSANSFRFYPKGFVFDVNSRVIFADNPEENFTILAFGNNKFSQKLMKVLNPTLAFNINDFENLPFPAKIDNKVVSSIIEKIISIAKKDWDSFETSWNFQFFPFLDDVNHEVSIEQSFDNWQNNCAYKISKMIELETENNRLFIEAYDLQDELSSEVPENEITLARANRKTDIERLISYAISCMMGRYSLDHPGLIYAYSCNKGFDSSKFSTFPADDDGIIPIMDQDWFPDDATKRFVKFLKVAWSPETLDENLRFVADSLNPKNNEAPVNTIRRYLSTNFFKDHLKTYKKRPIYWLFSSGRQKAFECLVYLHRYNESTLSRMRSTYVTPLQGNISARLEFLQNEKDAAASASAQRKFQKEIDVLRKKQTELSAFDDELRHYADMKISLDLDDGVKVNYGKFGNLLAEKKSITGKK